MSTKAKIFYALVVVTSVSIGAVASIAIASILVSRFE